MKTIKKVSITPLHVEFIPDKLEQDILYISLEYKTAIHLCLCDCGNLTVTPLHPINGWTLTKNNKEEVTISPSIGNYYFPCKSHYIITNNVANFV